MRTLAVLLLGTILASGCAREEEWNVLIVTFDTTRADYLGCYGHPEDSSPNVDALAAEGTLFEKAFSTNPITLPSHTSIMTGTYPLFHGVRDNTTYVVRDDVRTLAEVLGENGYDTAAVTGSFVLDSQFNLDQGFGDYNDRLSDSWSTDELEARGGKSFGFAERKASLVSAAAIDWLRKPRSKPFFMWLHYFDPHHPINPPEPHHSAFRLPYTGEIAFADEQFGVVLSELKKQGVYEKTIVILTADHGEGLLDHGEPTHSLLIFDSVLQVPLVIKVPGLPAGQRFSRLTSTVDIMPTLLELLEVEAPEDIQGRSFARLVKGGEDLGSGDRAVYMESFVPALQCNWGALRGLRTADTKIIHGPKPRLYAVDTDPGEVYDLAAKDPDRLDEMISELERKMAQWTDADASASASAPDQETLEKLASLGYVGRAGGGASAVPMTLDEVAGKDDPIEQRWIFDLMGIATENLRAGAVDKGIEQLLSVIAADPDNPSALTYLAKAYFFETQQIDLAKVYLTRTIEADPEQEEALFILSRIARLEGDYEQAKVYAERIRDFQPASLGALYELAGVSVGLGDTEGARKYLRDVLELDPSNVPSALELGLSYARDEMREDAGKYLKMALDLDPQNPGVLYNVGIWYYQNDEIVEAMRMLGEVVELDPLNPGANYVLGMLHYGRDEAEPARKYLLRALKTEALNETRIARIRTMLDSLGTR